MSDSTVKSNSKPQFKLNLESTQQPQPEITEPAAVQVDQEPEVQVSYVPIKSVKSLAVKESNKTNFHLDLDLHAAIEEPVINPAMMLSVRGDRRSELSSELSTRSLKSTRVNGGAMTNRKGNETFVVHLDHGRRKTVKKDTQDTLTELLGEICESRGLKYENMRILNMQGEPITKTDVYIYKMQEKEIQFLQNPETVVAVSVTNVTETKDVNLYSEKSPRTRSAIEKLLQAQSENKYLNNKKNELEEHNKAILQQNMALLLENFQDYETFENLKAEIYQLKLILSAPDINTMQAKLEMKVMKQELHDIVTEIGHIKNI